jgi:tRNA-binding protein
MNLTKQTITWQDFEKLDLRVGTIVQVESFPKAHKPAYKICGIRLYSKQKVL